MTKTFGLTAVENIPKFYPIVVEYNFEKKLLYDCDATLPQSGKIEGIEHAEWTLRMYKAYQFKGRGENTFYWVVELDVKTKIPLKCEVCFEIASEDNSVLRHYHDVIDGSKSIRTNNIFANDDSEFRNDSHLTLRVKAEFSYTTEEDQRIYGATKLIQNIDWLKRLQNHCQKDFKLIVGNESVEIHKPFLIIESSVFAAMLENEKYKETQKGEVQITDFKMNTVKAVVAWCYGEDISEFIKFTENAMELLKFIDKYDMENLKASFEEYYSKKLTKGNVATVLAAAHKFNATALENKCISFIQSLPRIDKTSIVYGSLDEELRELVIEDN